MNVLAEKNGRIYAREAIDRPNSLVSPFKGKPFPCLIWDHDGHFTDAERSAVAGSLLGAGCSYAVCGGKNCEAWHDALDAEYAGQHPDETYESPNSGFVMTSCHQGESPDDVAFFFVLNTNFDDHHFKRFLVLHIGRGPAQVELDAAVRKYAFSNNAA